jgi:hypothetical protein
LFCLYLNTRYEGINQSSGCKRQNSAGPAGNKQKLGECLMSLHSIDPLPGGPWCALYPSLQHCSVSKVLKAQATCIRENSKEVSQYRSLRIEPWTSRLASSAPPIKPHLFLKTSSSQSIAAHTKIFHYKTTTEPNVYSYEWFKVK